MYKHGSAAESISTLIVYLGSLATAFLISHLLLNYRAAMALLTGVFMSLPVGFCILKYRIKREMLILCVLSTINISIPLVLSKIGS